MKKDNVIKYLYGWYLDDKINMNTHYVSPSEIKKVLVRNEYINYSEWHLVFRNIEIIKE